MVHDGEGIEDRRAQTRFLSQPGRTFRSRRG
jgi:hypothetical protein